MLVGAVYMLGDYNELLDAEIDRETQKENYVPPLSVVRIPESIVPDRSAGGLV